MATDPAVSRDRTHRLWQVPTFLVGLAGLFALWHSGERLRPSVPEQYRRALVTLRPAVDRWPPDVDRIQAALRRMPKADPPADLAIPVKYALGSAYVALAEATTSSAEATEFWALALKHLEALADEPTVPEADQKKLRYRLARAWANTPGTDPQRTIEALTQYLPAGDDPAEGHRLLADLHLAATPPNEPLARDNLREFLKHVSGRADARALNQARVRLADLHAKLNEPDEARKVLERVGADAPPELLAGARMQLAKQHQLANDWSSAAKLWEQVRDMRGATEAQQSEALVRLTEAYARLDRPADAQIAAKAVTKGDAPGSAAATFRMAELALKDPSANLDSIVTSLESAFAGDIAAVKKHIPIADAKRVCVDAIQRAQQSGSFAQAERIIKAYARVAVAGHHQRLMAELHVAWAAAEPMAAREHFRVAAESFESAGVESPGAEGVDQLRRAAELFGKSNDRAKMLVLLGDIAKRLVTYPIDRAGVVWTEVGDAYLAAGDKAQARTAFKNAADKPGSHGLRVKVRLAALLEDGDAATAIPMLKEVADSTPADPKVREEAIYLLGETHLVAKQWSDAEVRLKAALTAYPTSPRAARGRYQLGQVFRQRASIEARKIETDRAEIRRFDAERIETRNVNLYVQEQTRVEDHLAKADEAYREALQAAFDEFRKAEEALTADAIPDADVIRKTMFWTADCAFFLGQYADAAGRFEKLAARYRDKADELEALGNLYRTCAFAVAAAQDDKTGDPLVKRTNVAEWSKRGLAAHAAVKDALGRIPATELNGGSDLRRRDYWEKWLRDNDPKGME